MMEFTRAKIGDIGVIQAMLQSGVEDGTILYRSRDTIATNIRSYTLIRDSGRVVGSVALHIHTEELGEVRSLFIDSKYRNRGLAGELVNRAIEEGRELQLKNILTLTYRDNLFRRLGFLEIEKSQLPNTKIWADCMSCKEFPVCDEIALLKEL
jgi:amino-acid N-acetyltransferase